MTRVRPELRIDRAAAERILSGERRPAGGFGAVLAAATRPATPAEMMREEMAVAAFLTRPPLAEASRPAGRVRYPQPLARRIVLGTALIGAVLSGATVAAASGALPGFLPSWGPPPPGPRPSAATPTSPWTTSAGSTTPSAIPSTTPAVVDELSSLCQAYEQAVATGKKPSPHDPAFDRLRAAAGGNQNIHAFCQTLSATPGATSSSAPPHPSAPAHPSHPPHPGGQPAGAPSPQPSSPSRESH